MSSVSALNHFDNLNFEGSDFIRAVTEAAQFLLFSYSPALQALVAWSPNSEAVLGMQDQEILNGPNAILRHAHEEDRFRLLQAFEQALETKQSLNVTYRWLRPDNQQLRWLNCRAKLTQQGTDLLFEGVISDFSEQVSWVNLHGSGGSAPLHVLESINSGIVLLDEELRVLAVNSKLLSLGFIFEPELKDLKALIPGTDFRAALASVDSGELLLTNIAAIINSELESYRTSIARSGHAVQIEIAPVLVDQAVRGLTIVISDQSKLAETQQRLSDLLKLESLHSVSLGVAHNFNNTLQSIVGSALLIEKHARDWRFVKKTAQNIFESAQAGSELSRQLQELEYGATEQQDNIDLNVMLLAAIKRLSHQGAAAERVRFFLGSNNKIRVSVVKLERLLEQILDSYRRLMEPDDFLEISTFPVQKSFKTHTSSTRSGFTALRICFTEASSQTKQIHKLIKELSDAISQIGAQASLPDDNSNCELTIYFPTQTVEPQSQQADDSKPTKLASSLGKILLIDDDKMVLDTIQAILIDLGYECICSDNEIGALALFKKHAQHLALVIVDAIMPGTEGSKIIKQLKRINKTVPVVGFSGAEDQTIDRLSKAGADGILKKPVGVQELQTALEKFARSKSVRSSRGRAEGPTRKRANQRKIS